MRLLDRLARLERRQQPAPAEHDAIFMRLAHELDAHAARIAAGARNVIRIGEDGHACS